MTYERTMQIKYNNEQLTDMNMRKLAYDLQQEGLNMVDWGYGDMKIEFGYRTITEDTTVYVVRNARGKIAFSSNYESVANDVYQQIKGVYKVSKDTIQEEVSITDWVKPRGNRLSLEESSENYTSSTDINGNYDYGNGIRMTVKLHNGYSGVRLEFKTTWATDKIQRGEIIKDMLVKKQLTEVGKIQNIVESCLADFMEIPEQPTIDCHFDAKTETRSECSPDIINLVREARNQ